MQHNSKMLRCNTVMLTNKAIIPVVTVNYQQRVLHCITKNNINFMLLL